MKRSVSLSLVVAFGLALAGCASTQPVGGFIYADVGGPVAISSNSRGPLHGEACATSYLGMVALGDATITAAAKTANIMTISHVEQHSSNILGIIVKYCTEVWGFNKTKGDKSGAAAAQL